MDNVSLTQWFTHIYQAECSDCSVGTLGSVILCYLVLFALLTVWRLSANRSDNFHLLHSDGSVLGGFIAHQGYAIYIMAGASLIRFPAETMLGSARLAPLFVWLAGFFFVLSTESFKPAGKYFDSSVSFSRLIIFPVSCCVITWMWAGANWFI